MSIPRATLRLQFHRDFRFDDALAQLDYAAALGVSHLYASPIWTARAGSTHGYDVTDPTRVNPELGGEDGLRRLVHALHARNMGLIVDIVPNHMALGEDNPWWRDVLLWGRHSAYAEWFDIDWQSSDPALYGKVLLPVLGQSYGSALRAGDIGLALDGAHLFIVCPGMRLPLAPALYAEVLSAASSSRLCGAVAAFGRVRDADRQTHRQALAAQAWRALETALADPATHADAVAALTRYAPDSASGRLALHTLLECQHLRLCDWRNAGDEINWRRFFEISDLIGMRVEREDVFDAMHALLFRLAGEGLIDGVRIDHIDGLAEPAAYVQRLRNRLEALCPDRPVYIVAEKILGADECLPADWGLDGTTGYDFMDQVAAVLHDATGAAALNAAWHVSRAEPDDYGQLVRAARRRLLERNFASEFQALVLTLHALARAGTDTRDVTRMAIRRCMQALLVHFPVYRTYGTRAGCNNRDCAVVRAASVQARAQLRVSDHAVLDVVTGFLSTAQPEGDDPRAPLRWRALTRFQQLTPPLTAKSVEDTVFYRYGRLLSRNEVGADASRLALRPADFHRYAARRRHDFPHAMLATATHDHKRGEDARMRLAVLSELPEQWQAALQQWHTMNQSEQSRIDYADEMMLYQTLIGVWPMEKKGLDTGELAARVGQWQRKALREAKRRSDWTTPDEEYEAQCDAFLQSILRTGEDNGFLPSLDRFVADIAAAGVLNSLSQTMLKLTVPGVPDLYQGSECWDFSLVDPDNRRPVDYAGHRQMLHEHRSAPLSLAHWHSGACKQQLIRLLLQCRADKTTLFRTGDYRALAVEGVLHDNLIAFARHDGDQTAVVLCSRHAARLIHGRQAVPLIPVQCWGDTVVRLPADWAQTHWKSALTGMHGSVVDHCVVVAQSLTQFPVDLLLLSASR